MKIKIYSLIAFSIIHFSVFAQDKLSFGLRAGINFQNLNGKDATGATLKNNLVVRYHLGANLEIPLVPDFYIQPNLLFSTKGASTKYSNFGQSYTSAVNLYYLELPVNFLYKPLLGKGHLILGFGPYLAYALGGKVVTNGNNESIVFKNSSNANDPNPVYKPLDAGANLLFGYEFASKISFQLNAQLGMLNINPSFDGPGSTSATQKNTGFGISMGYRF